MKKIKPDIWKKVFNKLTWDDRVKLRQEKAKSKVNTKRFRTKQTFGAASKVRRLTVEEYIKNGGDPNILNGSKNDR